jgi:hypothetical protein
VHLERRHGDGHIPEQAPIALGIVEQRQPAVKRRIVLRRQRLRPAAVCYFLV